jgi:hypothetical protein
VRDVRVRQTWLRNYPQAEVWLRGKEDSGCSAMHDTRTLVSHQRYFGCPGPGIITVTSNAMSNWEAERIHVAYLTPYVRSTVVVTVCLEVPLPPPHVNYECTILLRIRMYVQTVNDCLPDNSRSGNDMYRKKRKARHSRPVCKVRPWPPFYLCNHWWYCT